MGEFPYAYAFVFVLVADMCLSFFPRSPPARLRAVREGLQDEFKDDEETLEQHVRRSRQSYPDLKAQAADPSSVGTCQRYASQREEEKEKSVEWTISSSCFLYLPLLLQRLVDHLPPRSKQEMAENMQLKREIELHKKMRSEYEEALREAERESERLRATLASAQGWQRALIITRWRRRWAACCCLSPGAPGGPLSRGCTGLAANCPPALAARLVSPRQHQNPSLRAPRPTSAPRPPLSPALPPSTHSGRVPRLGERWSENEREKQIRSCTQSKQHLLTHSQEYPLQTTRKCVCVCACVCMCVCACALKHLSVCV